MSLEKLQKLPTQNQPNAAGVLMQTVFVLLGITMLACWTATQYAAWKLAFQPALGEPVLAFKSWKLYMPFDFFVWMIRFGHVEGTESAWSGGEWILASLHFLFVPAIWMAVARSKKFGGKTDLHGSAKWAEPDDIYNAGLLRRPLTALQRMAHAVIDVDKLPGWMDWLKQRMGAKPIKGASGCYIGAWIDPETNQYHYLTHDGPEHILAFAPTRSGKGVGLVLPTLLSWPASAVVHDIKGEAWALTAGYRKAKGHKVLKFEPANEDGTSIRFNPLEEIRIGTMREVADAQNIAQMIVDPDGKGMEDHWAKTGHELLSAAILHILYASPNKTLRGLVSFFCDPTMTIEQVAESMLNTEHDPDGKQRWEDPITGRLTKVHPVVAESARSFLNKSENERSGVQSTAMSFLSLYRDPIVAMNTAVSEFKVNDLMNSDTPVSLYLVVPPNDKGRLRPLIRLVLNQIFRQTTEKMDFADGRSVAGYKHRLLMMLDEFPALGKLELVEESLAFVAGYGIKCYLITQDLTQLYKAYTKDESIISNCHIRVAYAPNKVETAELLSKYCGVTTINKQQRSYSGSRLNPFLMHVMAAEQETQRPLLTPDECLRLPGAVKTPDGKNIVEPGDMLILPAGANPVYGKQILYFKDPVFDGRAKIKPPRKSDRLRERPAKAAPIPCDPALAAVQVEARKSELDDMIPATPEAAPALPVAVPAAAAVAAVAVATATVPANEKQSVYTAPTPAPEAAPVPQPAAPEAPAAPAVEYTAEELAALDAEADAETEVEVDAGDPEVEAAMRAEADAEEGTAAPAADESTRAGDGLLDFDV